MAAFAAVLMPQAQAQLPAVLPYGARLQLPIPSTPGKITRDAAGNIFAIQPATPAIFEIPVNGPIQIVVPSTDPAFGQSLATKPAGFLLTADPAGNLYIVQRFYTTVNTVVTVNANAITYEIPRNANGTYGTSTIVASALAAAQPAATFNPTDLVVDAFHNIYYSSSYGILATNSSLTNTAGTNSRYVYGVQGTALTNTPNSIAVNAGGDVFYVDKVNAWEIPAAMAQGASPAASIQIGVTSAPTCTGCTALTAPNTVFLDTAGDLFIGNLSNFFLVPNIGSAFSTASTTYKLPSGPITSSGDFGAADNNGNLLLHYGGSLEFYGAGKFYAGPTSVITPIAVGTVSSTSYASPSAGFLFTQTVTLANIAGTVNEPYAIVNYGSANGGVGPAQTTLNTGSGSSTCTAGATYTAGQTCTVEIGYQPKDPGSFTGALVMYSSTGSILATVDIASLATGSALAIDSGAATTVGTGYLAPAGIALDNTGAVYVADPVSNSVLKYAAGSTTAGTASATGLSEPSGVAIDAAGNLYIADTGNDRVVVVPAYQSGLATASQFTLAIPGTALSSPRGVAIDSFGDIFIADTGNARVVEVANPFSGAVSSTTTVVASGLSAPYGIAVDPYNNLFIADKGANAVYEVPTAFLTYTSTAAPGSGNPVTVGSGFLAPTGVATDGSGSIYIADSGNKRIVKVPSETGILTPADQVVLYANLNMPYGIATDLTADLYYSDQAAPSVTFVKRSAGSGSTATSIAFGTVGTTASASQTAVASNTGLTTPLTFKAAVSSPSAPFTEGSTTCSTANTLAPGTSCTVALTYSPTATGASTGSFTFTDNALAVTTATQNVSLTGYGSGTVASAALAGPATAVYGDDVTFTVSAKDSTGSVAVAANGPYTVNITGTSTSTASVTLTNGVGSFFLPSLGVGSYNLSVSVAGFSATGSIALSKAPLYVTASNASRLFDIANPTLSTSYSGFGNGDSASAVSGTAPTIATSATRVSPAGTYPVTLSGGSLTAANYTVTLVNGDLAVNGSVPQTVIFPPLPNFTHGTTVTLTGQSTSGLPVTYSVTGGSINGSVLTVGAAGAVTVTANQYGNGTYAGATPVVRSFTAQ